MFDLVKPIIDRLQELLEKRTSGLQDHSTCSHEFLEVVEFLESEATRQLEQYGLRKLDDRYWLPRREAEDLVIAFYVVDNLLVELGIKGYNKCAPFNEMVERVGPPRVYARVYAPGMKVVATIEAEEAGRQRRGEEKPSPGYIF